MCKTSGQEAQLERKEHCHLFLENKTGLKQGDPLSPILFNLALQKVIQSIKMVPSGIKTGNEQLNVLAHADDIALIRKNDTGIRKNFFFVEMQNIARNFGLRRDREKTKMYDSGKEEEFREK